MFKIYFLRVLFPYVSFCSGVQHSQFDWAHPHLQLVWPGGEFHFHNRLMHCPWSQHLVPHRPHLLHWINKVHTTWTNFSRIIIIILWQVKSHQNSNFSPCGRHGIATSSPILRPWLFHRLPQNAVQGAIFIGTWRCKRVPTFQKHPQC